MSQMDVTPCCLLNLRTVHWIHQTATLFLDADRHKPCATILHLARDSASKRADAVTSRGAQMFAVSLASPVASPLQ